MEADKIILGIDPGTNVLGYGLIKQKGRSVELMTLGVIELHKFDNHYIKLQKIFSRVLSIIDEYNPDEMAIEAPFFGKNVQSMLKLGRAQGVAMAAALNRNIPIFEYAPRKVKMSITGVGSASKEQVALMLQRTIKLGDIPQFLDATDALAVALCHYYQSLPNIMNKGEKYNSWKDFIRNNPGKVKN